MRLRVLFMAAALLLTTAVMPASATEWQFDKVHSSVYFDIRHIHSVVRGAFAEYDGTIVFDPAEPTKGSLTFTIKPASVDTGIAKRDDHLRTDDFFGVEKYPEIRFASTSITPEGDNLFTVSGTLTIKGKTHMIEVPMVYYAPVENPMKSGQMVAGFDFAFTVDRLKYGVGDGRFYKMGIVGKDVDLLVTLEMFDK